MDPRLSCSESDFSKLCIHVFVLFKLVISSFEFNFLKIKSIYSYFVNLMAMSRFCDLKNRGVLQQVIVPTQVFLTHLGGRGSFVHQCAVLPRLMDGLWQ